MKNNNKFVDLFKQGIFTHVYELTWTDKLRKKEVLNVEVIFNKALAIEVKDAGILLFKGHQLEIENESNKKGTSYFFLNPQSALTWIKAQQHNKIALAKNRKKYIVEELERIDAELKFYEVEVEGIVEELNKEKQELAEKMINVFKK